MSPPRRCPGGVPEWPIGTALKAVAGRNVSRGFESRPLCVTRYRLDRAHLMVTAGVCFLVAAAGVVVAFLSAGRGSVGGALTIIGAATAILALAVAAYLNLRPPTVATLDPVGLQSRGRGDSIVWKQVQDVSVGDGLLRFTDASGAVSALPLGLVERRQRADLIRDVYDRLNTANGYRRFDPAG